MKLRLDEVYRMLDREKVELMTKLALYEQNEGKEDFKINEYYRKDYIGYFTLWSILWVTVGYVVTVGLAAVTGLDYFLDGMSKSMLMKMVIAAGIVYLIVVIFYIVISRRIYNRKHRQARQRMRTFNYNLIKLLKMYDKQRQ